MIDGEPFAWPRAQFCVFCSNIQTDALHPVPGSLLVQEGLDVIDNSLLEAMPEDLLIREFNLHMKALDNEQLNQLRDFSSPRC
jgi:hypothetical protein